MRISDWSSDVCSSDLARFARPRRAAHRIRRQPTGGVLLHRRPLPQLPPLRARGVGAMSAFELRALLADASQNGSYFIDVRDREGLDEVARELGHAVAAIDLAGCRHTDDVPDRLALPLPFPGVFGSNHGRG